MHRSLMFFLLVSYQVLSVAQHAFPDGPVPRTVLSFYDSTIEHPETTRTHLFFEMPLNHLGLKVRYQDIKSSLPGPQALADTRGVLLCLRPDTKLNDAAVFLKWLADFDTARQVMLMCSLAFLDGAATDPAMAAARDRVFSRIGAEYQGRIVPFPLKQKLMQNNPRLLSFERPLEGDILPPLRVVKASTPDTHVLLAAQSADLILHGSAGTYVAEGADVYSRYDPFLKEEVRQWFINPFILFALAFDTDALPVPDTTTEAGRRIFYGYALQEGGDQATHVEKYRGRRMTASEVVQKEIFEPYRDLGMAQYNKGESPVQGPGFRFDWEFQSYAWVSPLSRIEKGRLLVNTSSAGEDLYFKSEDKQFWQYRQVIETLRATGSPIRIKPFSLQFHMYSGLRDASLNSLISNLEYARSQELCPLSPERFGSIVDGFFSAVVERKDADAWIVSGRGSLQTIRFDKASMRSVDFQRSQGVIGQRRLQGSLYVYLDKSVDRAEVALSPVEGKPSPYLISSRWPAWDYHAEKDSVSFSAQGFGPGEMSWVVPWNGATEIETSEENSAPSVYRTDADKDGHVHFRLRESKAPSHVIIRRAA